MATVINLDLKIVKENLDEGIKEIVKVLRPGWKRENVSSEPLLGGHVNQTVKIFSKSSDDDDSLVLRINAELNLGIARDNELLYIKLLSDNGIGVPLLATFNNGMVSKFVQGKPMDHEDMKGVMTDPKFARGMATLLAEMHHVSPISSDRPTKDSYYVCRLAKAGLAKLKQGHFRDQDLSTVTDVVSWDEAGKELDSLFSEAEKLQIPVCLNHNDLWHANILYDQKNDMTPPEIIESEFSRAFIKTYLEKRNALRGKETPVSEKELDQYYHWTEICKMMFLCVWPGYLCALCGQIENGFELPFDPKEKYLIWYKEYMSRKKKFEF